MARGNKMISSVVHSRFTFCERFFRPPEGHISRIILLIILFGLATSAIYSQTPESEEKLQAGDLPEVIRVQLTDTTQIALEPRSRFNDSSEPKLTHALALYAKERRWNLPPILTPNKAIKPQPASPKNYMLHLAAYPSLPDAFFYNVLLGGHLNETRGFLHLNRRQLGDGRTEGRGDYSVDEIRGRGSYQYHELSEITLDAGLNLKDLEWLPSTVGNPNFQKELQFFRSDLNWKQQISDQSHSTLTLNAELFRMTHVGESKPTDEGADLRFNYDMVFPLPFQNPFHIGDHVDINPAHLGADVEYFSATDERLERDIWGTIFRFYIRDSFTTFGPFVLGLGAEGVSFRERDDVDGDKTRLQFNPYFAATTNFGKKWTVHLQGQRATHRSKLSALYFNTDYISLNPFLRPEKTWKGRALLKYYLNKRFEVNVAGFAKRIKDLVVLERLALDVPELTWIPTNIDASVYGGQLDIVFQIANRLDAQLQYTHESHEPEVGKQIAYRPKDLIDIKIVHYVQGVYRVELGGEFRGARHVNAETDETLESYFLLRPKVNKTIVDHIDVFVSGTFAIGEYALLQGYELSQSNVDFGIELRF